MTKTYTYDVCGETTYLERSDELEEFPTRSIEYTATHYELKEGLAQILCDRYFSGLTDQRVRIIVDLNMLLDDNDDIVEQLVETYDDELHEYFKKDALNDTF